MESVPYRPQEGKRFHVSPDRYSRERLYRLRDAVVELDAMFPSLRIGCTLFGSLAKGRPLDAHTASHADVDVFVLYDSATFRRPDGTIDYAVAKDLLESAHVTQDMLFEFYFRYLQKRHNALIRGAAVDAAYMLFPRLTSVDLLELYMEKVIDEKVGSEVYTDVYMRSVNSRSSDAYEDFLTHKINSTQMPAQFIFGLDVGGRMRQHARALLSRMASWDRVSARLLWQRIRRNSMLGERIFFNPHKYSPVTTASTIMQRSLRLLLDKTVRRRYPATFEEACAKYGVIIEPFNYPSRT